LFPGRPSPPALECVRLEAACAPLSGQLGRAPLLPSPEGNFGHALPGPCLSPDQLSRCASAFAVFGRSASFGAWSPALSAATASSRRDSAQCLTLAPTTLPVDLLLHLHHGGVAGAGYGLEQRVLMAPERNAGPRPSSHMPSLDDRVPSARGVFARPKRDSCSSLRIGAPLHRLTPQTPPACGFDLLVGVAELRRTACLAPRLRPSRLQIAKPASILRMARPFSSSCNQE